MEGGYISSNKVKRKDFDDFSDDFSLSSPARKIRRLDVDLPPIMEEEEPGNGVVVEQQLEAEEKEPMVDENQERAIVVFKHVNNNPFLLHSPSNLTVSVGSDFISGIKNQYLWWSQSSNRKTIEEDTTDNSNCMAVVPWVPFQLHSAQGTDISEAEAPELMDAEQAGESAMEIEGATDETLQQRHESGLDGIRGNEGLPQWQQQHCFVPQLPYNTSMPISWSH